MAGKLIKYVLLLCVCVIISQGGVDAGQKKKHTRRAPAKPAAAVQAAANYGTYNFTFTTTEGRKRHLADFSGKTVLVNIWTPSCAPCSVETQGFVGLYRKYHPKGLEILSIGVHAGESDARSFSVATGALWPVGLSDDIAGIVGAFGLPDSYLFLPDGTMAKHFVGYTKQEVLEPVVRDAVTTAASSRRQ